MSDRAERKTGLPFEGPERFVPPFLDYLLTTAECASWLNIAEETLSIQVSNGEIPSIDLNQRVRLFHARSVLLALGAEPTSLVFPESVGFLDAFLTTQECAHWFQMSLKTFRGYVHAGKIRAQGTNERFWRFHPRSVLTKLGVKPKALPPQLARAA